MTANTQPIVPLTPNNGAQNIVLAAANTAKDGTGTTATVFTAGANGAFASKLTLIPIGTNVPTVVRVFENNGSSSAAAANNKLIAEVTVGTATLSEVAAQTPVVFNLKRAMAAGYKLLLTVGTTVAAGIAASVEGGDY